MQPICLPTLSSLYYFQKTLLFHTTPCLSVLAGGQLEKGSVKTQTQKPCTKPLHVAVRSQHPVSCIKS
ncbi:hypothetical protein NC651_012073 [Populus alba x Populus x berolinensis]|nr:hypothetical protein NC651_012073 [Populus alba x Populus x berolinensis]